MEDKTIYLVVTYTVYDGEFEYLSQTTVDGTGDPKKLAEDSVKHAWGVEKDAKPNERGQWEITDYRLLELDKYVEITKEEYDIISKYIY